MTHHRLSMPIRFFPPRLWHLLAIVVIAGLVLPVNDAFAAARKADAKKPSSPRVAVKAGASKPKLVAKIRVKKESSLSSKRSAKSTQYAHVSSRKLVAVRHVTPVKPSFGQIAGLHDTPDELELKSSVALVIDQDTREVLVRKNESAVLPIASLTKLMTALLISEHKLPMDELITITDDDVDTEKGSRSRLKVGTTLSRGEMLHLALMSSENRAAHALGRTHPNGMTGFVRAMNARARELGMSDTRYVEPTGLSSRNQSSAQDLATLVSTAHSNPVLRQLSTSEGYQIDVGDKTLQYINTNRLIGNPEWDIGLQKTGYISEAGRCLVMQARIAGRKLIMVFLDSSGKLSRLGDAERVKRWIESNTAAGKPQTPPLAVPAAASDVVVRRISG
jgi:serine-type D-Ala-D-Ala endopeptidase (penicillin-binding protein 7)